MSHLPNSPVLPLAVFAFHFEVEGVPRLPRYPGSAWRGAFGHALRNTVCVAPGTECPACRLYRSCVYPYLFETPPPPDSTKLRRYPAAPHPFVLRLEPGRTATPYRLGLILFGRAERSLPEVIRAFEQAGKAGLGAGRQRFELAEVCQAADPVREDFQPVCRAGGGPRAAAARTPALPACPKAIEIRLETPLRLKREEHLVTAARFGFADLFASLLRRISLLSHFHTDTPLDVDFAALSRAAREVPIRAPELRWYDWTRYSSRQKATLEMGGLLGRFRLDGADIEPFWPYLWLGQWTHAGKGATMGLGRYRIRTTRWPEVP
jgi:hypothetical protein